MVENNQDVKTKVTDADQKTSTDKDQDKAKEKDTQSQTVPYERFKEVNDERNSFRQKAEALDSLWADPDFQSWLESKEKGETKPSKEDIEEDLDKPLTLREAREVFRGVFKEEVQPYLKEREKDQLDAAIKEVAAMEQDDKKYPYFKPFGASKETDAIRNEMIRLMEKEGVQSMDKAYKIATYDLKDVERQKEVEETRQAFKQKVRGRSTVALAQQGPKLYKNIREAAEESADKLDF